MKTRYPSVEASQPSAKLVVLVILGMLALPIIGMASIPKIKNFYYPGLAVPVWER